jgi:cyclophilin family peptidyl-prolyl cis-trans isomerase
MGTEPRKPRIKLIFAALCIGGIMMAMQLSGCASEAPEATAAPNETQTEAAADPATEAPVEGPTPTPITVDLSLYEEVPLPQLEDPTDGEEIAILNTSMGAVKIRFFPDLAPKAVQNWKTHAKSGYYDGTIFHRVIKDFMIQGGDPQGTGTGGQSIWGAPFEMEQHPSLHFIRGALGMARSTDEVSQGSQFFIVQNSKLDSSSQEYVDSFREIQDQVFGYDQSGNPLPFAQLFPVKIIDVYTEIGGYPSLDYNYTVFGHVIDGMDVVDQIAAVETESDKPLADVTVNSIAFEPYKK